MFAKRLEQPKLLIFDLDGTLLDSAPDLMAALTAVREYLGLTGPTPERAAQFVSSGAAAMIRAGVPAEFLQSSAQLENLRQRFLQHYEAHICVRSRLYDGAATLLERCDRLGIAWAIATNKPFYLADKLLPLVPLKPAVLVGGDSLARKKPDPLPLHFICEQLGIRPEQSWMIGDDPRDIEAGRAAGCAASVACVFGYLGDAPPIDQWGADAVIRGLSQLTLELVR